MAKTLGRAFGAGPLCGPGRLVETLLQLFQLCHPQSGHCVRRHSPVVPQNAPRFVGTRIFEILGRNEFALRQGFRPWRKRLDAPSARARFAGRGDWWKRYCSSSSSAIHRAATASDGILQSSHKTLRVLWGPGYLKSSGEMNSPCGKVFARGENAWTRLRRGPALRAGATGGNVTAALPALPSTKRPLRPTAFSSRPGGTG